MRLLKLRISGSAFRSEPRKRAVVGSKLEEQLEIESRTISALAPAVFQAQQLKKWFFPSKNAEKWILLFCHPTNWRAWGGTRKTCPLWKGEGVVGQPGLHFTDHFSDALSNFLHVWSLSQHWAISQAGTPHFQSRADLFSSRDLALFFCLFCFLN